MHVSQAAVVIEEFMFYRPAEELQPEDILAAMSGERSDPLDVGSGGCTPTVHACTVRCQIRIS